jgi:DNA-binding LacI/PurR family transcriptional regulator
LELDLLPAHTPEFFSLPLVLISDSMPGMGTLRILTAAEQVGEHLRAELCRGAWGGQMPGGSRLAAELGVGRDTVEAALQILERDKLLVPQGAGRRRRIELPKGMAKHPLRVAILRHDERFTDNLQSSTVLTEITHALQSAGHVVVYSKKSQVELKHHITRLIHQLTETQADAWVVEAGSRPLLEWCSTQATPCLALCGRTGDLPLARVGPDTLSAYGTATRHLLALGHRRIVLILNSAHRKPTPGKTARVFLETLSAHGVPTGDYNLPDWDDTPEGFSRLLESLFKSTPPTALIIDELPHFFAALAFFLRRGIQVPGQVSVVSSDNDAMLDWNPPGFARMHWDNRLIVRRVLRWVNSVREGKADRKSILIPAEFIPSGSIRPVWKG